MRKILVLSAACLGIATASQAQSIGACAWSKEPPDAHSAFLDAFRGNIRNGTSLLAPQHQALHGFFVACAGRGDIPAHIEDAAVGAAAIQDGAAIATGASLGISRADLDQAWLEAPAPARDCTRANAAKAFGLLHETCTDPKAPLWFAEHFHVAHDADTPELRNLLYYYNAKAQTEWADAFITKFVSITPKSAQPNVASYGDLTVTQVATDNANAFITEWQKQTPGVRLATTTKAARNKPIVTFFIFKGCKPDGAGNCNVTADFDVIDPSGKPSTSQPNSPLWVGPAPRPASDFQLSKSSFGLIFDSQDPVGAYRVQASVTDHVAGVTVHTEQAITVTAQ